MTTKITRQFWLQVKNWFNFWTAESIETDDSLSEVTELVQWTSMASSFNQLRKWNIEQISEKVEWKVEWREIKRLESLKDSLNYLEEASKESDPELQEKWANLLANWLTGATKIGRYIDILKQLSADEVGFLDKIYEYVVRKITENSPKISELWEQISGINNSLTLLYSDIWLLLEQYYTFKNDWNHTEAENLKNNASLESREKILKFEEIKGRVPWLNIEIWWLEKPDFYIQEIIWLNDIRELGEVIDNFKRLNLLDNAYASWILLWNETLITSNKFRLQLTDLWLSFIKACKNSK